MGQGEISLSCGCVRMGVGLIHMVEREMPVVGATPELRWERAQSSSGLSWRLLEQDNIWSLGKSAFLRLSPGIVESSLVLDFGQRSYFCVWWNKKAIKNHKENPQFRGQKSHLIAKCRSFRFGLKYYQHHLHSPGMELCNEHGLWRECTGLHHILKTVLNH